jgi:hypothetical protein
MKERFQVGRLVETRAVFNKHYEDRLFTLFVRNSLERYISCDWGELSEHDKRENDLSVKHNDRRIFANYEDEHRKDWRIWIITEADRSCTTILFPKDY